MEITKLLSCFNFALVCRVLWCVKIYPFLHIFTLFSVQSSKATRLENALDLKQKESFFHSSKYISDKNKAFEDASPEYNNFS